MDEKDKKIIDIVTKSLEVGYLLSPVILLGMMLAMYIFLNKK